MGNSNVRKAFIGHLGDTQELKAVLNKLVDRLLGDCEVITANRTLSEEDSGKTFLIGTNGLTITLPSTAVGLKYTFINTGADGNVEIIIDPATLDAIHGTTNASTNVVFNGTDNANIKNTKASATTGDNITLLGDGDAGWYVVGCHGIWANV